MKAAREHRVPLSERALAILADMAAARCSEFVFPGEKPGKPLSIMAFDMTLRRMGVEATVHGFRSTFRDWASERTSFPHEVCEMALAHAIPNKSEAAYRRGDLLEKRRQLMAAWARFRASTMPWWRCMVARHKGPRTHERKGADDWSAETLLRKRDGAPLAEMLRRAPGARGGNGLVPKFLLSELANLLDPHSASYNRRRITEKCGSPQNHCADQERNANSQP
jgi:hypothetical protein